MNQILSYVCLNGIVMPRRVWILEHQFHHANPGHPDDGMILDSNSFLGDIKQLLLSKHDTKLVEELAKLPLIVAMLFLPLYCLPIIWITTLSSFAYLSLATHIVDPNIRELDHESPKAAEDIALNIFPKSHLFTFLAGGLNIHAAHHLNPRWTRWELMQESDNHPSKKIETVKDYWYLIKSR
jgi:fatty acid desaturase